MGARDRSDTAKTAPLSIYESASLIDEVNNGDAEFRKFPGRSARFLCSNAMNALVKETYNQLIPFNSDKVGQKWKWRTIDNGFSMFTLRRNSISREPSLSSYHVSVKGIIHNCSVRELKQILQAPNDAAYNALLYGMHGDHLIHGLVNQSKTISLLTRGNQSDSEETAMCQVFVRSGTYAKSHAWQRNDTWRSIDFICDEIADEKGIETEFTYCACTVGDDLFDPQDAETTTNLSQQCSVYFGYRMRMSSAHPKSVEIEFYAKGSAMSKGLLHNVKVKGPQKIQSMRKIRSWMNKMALGLVRFKEIIRRRRLGMQIYADTRAFGASNKCCVFCTKRLSVIENKRKRCNLCGNAICKSCGGIERVVKHGVVSFVRICRRCEELVEGGSYDSVADAEATRPMVKRTASISSNSLSNIIIVLLQRTYDKADETKKRIVVSLIKCMLKRQSGCTRNALLDELTDCTTSLDSQGMLAAIKDALIIKAFTMEECLLAQNESRNYAINHRTCGSTISVPYCPIPGNEPLRVKIIERNQYRAFAPSLQVLGVICEIAAAEMRFESSTIAIIDATELHIIASNNPAFSGLVLPREQTICAHALMSVKVKPLLVQNITTDVRFQNMDMIVAGCANVYFGFPITSEEGLIIGTLCCVDTQTREVNTEQYSIMNLLAETVSDILKQQVISRSREQQVAE